MTGEDRLPFEIVNTRLSCEHSGLPKVILYVFISDLSYHHFLGDFASKILPRRSWFYSCALEYVAFAKTAIKHIYDLVKSLRHYSSHSFDLASFLRMLPSYPLATHFLTYRLQLMMLLLVTIHQFHQVAIIYCISRLMYGVIRQLRGKVLTSWFLLIITNRWRWSFQTSGPSSAS